MEPGSLKGFEHAQGGDLEGARGADLGSPDRVGMPDMGPADGRECRTSGPRRVPSRTAWRRLPTRLRGATRAARNDVPR